MSILLREINDILRIHWKPFKEKDMSIRKSEWFNFKKRVCNFIDADFFRTKPYSSWEDLGLDSLDYVELIMFVEEEYDVDFDQAVDDIKSIGGLHGLLIRTLESQREVDVTHRDTEHTRSSLGFVGQNPGRCSHCGRGS
jgi:hypothetical protein